MGQLFRLFSPPGSSLSCLPDISQLKADCSKHLVSQKFVFPPSLLSPAQFGSTVRLDRNSSSTWETAQDLLCPCDLPVSSVDQRSQVPQRDWAVSLMELEGWHTCEFFQW